MDAQIHYLHLDLIRIDGGTQSRAHLNQSVINEYADLLSNSKDSLPPIKVFFDGQNYWNADGFHRLEAAKQANIKFIGTIVEQGTRRDAILYSVGANAEHGLRRTDEDKRRAATTLLTDDEWNKWSDNQIAKKCKVSQPFISALRKELANGSTDNFTSKEKRTYERNGKTHTMRTDNIGKSKPTQETQEPDRDPNTKEMFNSEQFKESVKQEIAKNYPELVQKFDQDVEIPSYNATYEERIKSLSKELTMTKVWLEDKKTQDEHARKGIEYSTGLEVQIIELEVKLESVNKALEEAKEKISALTETNNQLFLANEKLTCELVEIKQQSSDLNEWFVSEKEVSNQLLLNNEKLTCELEEANQKIATLTETNKTLSKELASIKIDLTGLENETLEEVCEEINSLKNISTKFYKINAAIEKASLRIGFDECISKNQDKSEYFFQRYHDVWKEAVDHGIEANNLKEEIKQLQETISQKDSTIQLDQMLAQIQSIFENSLEKGKEKREGIRIGRTQSTELLTAIKQTRGVE